LEIALEQTSTMLAIFLSAKQDNQEPLILPAQSAGRIKGFRQLAKGLDA